MNQYTTTAIINSVEAFKKAFKVDPKHVVEVFRHDGRWGRKEVAEVTLPVSTLVKGDVVRLEVRLHTVGAHLGEFQNALTRNSELFTYEALYDGSKDKQGNNDPNTLANALVSAAKSHRNTSKNFDFEMVNNSGKLELTAGADYIRFKEIAVNKVTINRTGYEAQDDLVTFASNKADANVALTTGMNGFGDTAWLINNFKLPTYVNTNWMALHQDERPVPGKLYDQITIHAVADRGELTGMGAVGQVLRSKTTHVFYVDHDIVGDSTKGIVKELEDILKANNCTIQTVQTLGSSTTANNATTQTYLNMPTKAIDTDSDGKVDTYFANADINSDGVNDRETLTLDNPTI